MAEGVDARGPGRDLVLPDRLHGPAVTGVDQGGDHRHRGHRHPPGPPEIGVGGQALEAQGAVGQPLEIVGQYPHHLAEPQGDDGQVIPPHPQHRETREKAETRGHQAPGQQGRREGQG